MNDRSRPKAAPETSFAGDSSTVAQADDKTEMARQLRRRRAASYRCPVLDDGRTDPIDKSHVRLPVQVRAIGASTVEFTGCDRAVYSAITSLCARYQRSPRGGAWLVKQTFADDVMALLEVRGYRLEVTL